MATISGYSEMGKLVLESALHESLLVSLDEIGFVATFHRFALFESATEDLHYMLLLEV